MLYRKKLRNYDFLYIVLLYEQVLQTLEKIYNNRFQFHIYPHNILITVVTTTL